MDRRKFIQVTALGTATLPWPGSTPAAEPDTPSAPGEMPRRVFGKTNESVTILGLGCAWLARAQKARDRKEQSSEAHSRAIVEAALEGGIRYFDTAPSYYLSEERLGAALAPVRDQVFLVTKLDHADAKSAEQDLVKSLKLLKTDHVDLLLLHGLGLVTFNDFDALQREEGAFSFLRQAKNKGLTRFIGFSSHPELLGGQRRLAAAAEVDVIQPFINYVSRTQTRVEEMLVAFARSRKIGVAAMKVLGGDGQLADDYDRAFRYALSIPGVHCAVIGASNPAEVQRAVRAARQFRPLTEAEMKETIELGRKLSEAKSRQATLLRRHAQQDVGSLA